MKKPTLLIIDDTPDNIQLLAQLLKEDYHLKVATSGQQGLKLAQSEPTPDLILLDVIMPEMDGYEVCKRLKEQKKTQHISIIFITGRNQIGDEEQGLGLGAVDYITKPFRPAIVEARIKTHITLIQQRDELTRLAMHDQLTGLHNRHFLMNNISARISNAKRHSIPLCLIIIDIDHFKAINDEYGHHTGDLMLKEIAKQLQRFCRAEDIIARIGGEEFLILLEYCDLKSCADKAEQIRQTIEQLKPGGIMTTASLGVAQLYEKNDNYDALFKRADDAAYLAKANGRNQVSCSNN